MNDLKKCQKSSRTSMNSSNFDLLQSENLTALTATSVIAVIALFIQLFSTLFNVTRKRIYKDNDNLDTAFDAGGKVSMGLTVTTIVATWTWSATLLESSTVTSKYGISGAYWYAAGATVQILFFSILAVQLKIRAPGAKTYLQLIRCRFGTTTHLIFCAYALLTNVIVLSMLMLGGTQAMVYIVDGYSVELASLACSIIIAMNCLTGGLGATFYASYFQSCGIFAVVLLFSIKLLVPTEKNQNSLKSLFETLSCADALTKSEGSKLLSMNSLDGFIFGVINLVGNFGAIFADQVYWQNAVAAKPKQAVMGFLIGGVIWFTVPFCFATNMGLKYLEVSVQNGKEMLNQTEVDNGLVAVAIAGLTWGKTGKLLILIVIILAVTSTGSSEVVAISSILVYDVYMTYVKPFRLLKDANTCVVCGKARGRKAFVKKAGCLCTSISNCMQCNLDDERRQQHAASVNMGFACRIHGRYREYMSKMSRIKFMCLLMTCISISPMTILLNLLKINMGWVYLCMGVIIGSTVVPIVLCLWWTRLNSVGMITGALGGTLTGILCWMATSSKYEGGLTNFFANTGREYSMLMGNLASILASCFLLTFFTFATSRFDKNRSKEVWEDTKDIDNPIYPWTELYKRELQLTFFSRIHRRPLAKHLEFMFAKEKRMAIVGSVTLSSILIFICPICSMMVGSFTFPLLVMWTSVPLAAAIAALIYLIIAPLVGEIKSATKVFNESCSNRNDSTQQAER